MEGVDDIVNDFAKAVALAKVIGGGSGGNPNTVETITGTLDDPWGSVDVAALVTALGNLGVTANMTVDGSTLDAGTFAADVRIKNSNLSFSVANLSGAVAGACEANWSAADGSMLNAYLLVDSTKTDISSYAASIPTSTVIVWHPMS